MKIYNKDGEMIVCDKEQFVTMLDAGYTQKPPEPKTEEAPESEKNDSEINKDEDISSEGAKVLKKKVLKKKKE